MSKELVETIYGQRSKFEVYRVKKSFGGFEFVIYKDADYWKGVFDDLSKAVQRAKDEG
ncbi:hypothetical protein OAE19_00465 [Porticoccaceae bacterium]|nr:hypothetical protein [Porticoccaceae bacterium]